MPPADMMGMPGMCNEMRRPMMLLVKVKKFNKQLSVCSTNNFIILPRNIRQKWRIFLFSGAEMLLFLYLFLGVGEISWQAEYRVLP